MVDAMIYMIRYDTILYGCDCVWRDSEWRFVYGRSRASSPNRFKSCFGSKDMEMILVLSSSPFGRERGVWDAHGACS